MSVFGDIIKRSASGISKKEDEVTVYYGSDGKDWESIKLDEYNGVLYQIGTNGQYPSIGLSISSTLSSFSGMTHCMIKDRNGEQQKLDRFLSPSVTIFKKEYNCTNDYIYNKQNGHKYTVKELEDDCKAFIDNILESENDFVSHM